MDLTFSVPSPTSAALTIRGADGLVLLSVTRDGKWTVGPEDAPEAARLFAEAVASRLFPRPNLVLATDRADSTDICLGKRRGKVRGWFRRSCGHSLCASRRVR